MRTWKYEAELIRVVDGDTIVCDIDQGMNHWARSQYVRLAGINAPEKTGDTKEAGLASMAYLESLIGNSVAGAFTQLFLVTVEYREFEKYGRVLAYVFVADPYEQYVTKDEVMAKSINQRMVDAGQAVIY